MSPPQRDEYDNTMLLSNSVQNNVSEVHVYRQSLELTVIRVERRGSVRRKSVENRIGHYFVKDL